MRSVRALMVVVAALAVPVARAEGVEERPGSNPSRLNGATTLRRTADGGLIAVGGSSLRRLGPGARAWETLHRVDGDGIYRVEVDGAGRVLAAWEKDSFIHYLTPSKQHTRFPKPAAPSPMSLWNVGQLMFLPNGRDALVWMSGVGGPTGDPWAGAAYRVALDGKSEPEVLFRADGGYLLHVSHRGAVFLMPRKVGQRCNHSAGCYPVAAIIAYEITEQGVVKKTLVDGEQVVMRGAETVYGPRWSTEEDRVLVLVGLERNEQALLRWRYGDEKPGYRPFHKYRSGSEYKMTAAGELVELNADGGGLELRRYPVEGAEQVTRLPLPPSEDVEDTKIHEVGERSDGSLWVHWGDYLVLLPPGKPARSYSLEPLLQRRTEWAGADVYVQSPEALWIGIERKGGRDFVRLGFADIDQRAKPWPTEAPR